MWGSEIRLWFAFLSKALPKRLKFNEVDIYMIKVKKKSARTRCEIVDKTNVKPLQSPLSSHSMLINERLTRWETEFSTKKPTIFTL